MLRLKENLFSTAAPLSLAVLAQACVRWPIPADWVSGKGGSLKRQEVKQSVSDRGGIQCCSTGPYERSDVFF